MKQALAVLGLTILLAGNSGFSANTNHGITPKTSQTVVVDTAKATDEEIAACMKELLQMTAEQRIQVRAVIKADTDRMASKNPEDALKEVSGPATAAILKNIRSPEGQAKWQQTLTLATDYTDKMNKLLTLADAAELARKTGDKVALAKTEKNIKDLAGKTVEAQKRFIAMMQPASQEEVSDETEPYTKKQYEAMAAKGDTRAMISLVLMYHQGNGVTLDYNKAMDWYLKAYEKKNGDALNNLGVMYRDGLGVTKNEKVAYLLFLAVHMECLGDEATQIRAGGNLTKLREKLPKSDVQEALSYTWAYVNQIVRSKGKNMTIGRDVLPMAKQPRIKDNGWWLDEERKKMDFKPPPPWN